MSGDTTESEMVARLADAVKRAADYTQQACRCIADEDIVSARIILGLQTCLRQASGCAYQLGHARHNPAFWTLRDQFEAISSSVSRVGLGLSPQHGMVLAQIGRVLDALHGAVVKMANAGVMPRADVLAAVNMRQSALVVH